MIDPASTVENNLRFPGQYWDAETGLHYNWHRTYDPQTGRYAQVDPIGFFGGDLNLYRYAVANPLSFTDIRGMFIGDFIGAVIGEVIGGMVPTSMVGTVVGMMAGAAAGVAVGVLVTIPAASVVAVAVTSIVVSAVVGLTVDYLLEKAGFLGPNEGIIDEVALIEQHNWENGGKQRFEEAIEELREINDQLDEYNRRMGGPLKGNYGCQGDS